jgi:hypothetical protein
VKETFEQIYGLNKQGIPLDLSEDTLGRDLNNFAEKLGHQFRVLKLLADNHGIKLNVDELMGAVITEVKRQVEAQGRDIEVHKFVQLVRKTSKTEDSRRDSFHKRFKEWCDTFVCLMSEIQAKFPWVDAKAIVEKVVTLKI